MQFNNIDLQSQILTNIQKQGYIEATEIQEKAIPLLLNLEADFIGQAQTGTGKTAAFLLPLLERINNNDKDIKALILSPTRELANQIYEEFLKLSVNLNINAEVVFGGASYDRQIRGIKRNRPQVIIGTPGRVIDLMNKKIINFSKTEYLILDEADEMLNMGFLDDVKLLLEEIPSERKIWMFSATMPRAISDLVKKEFNKPEIIKIEKKTMTCSTVEQSCYLVQRRYGVEALKRIIDTEGDVYAIIFCKTKVETADLANELTSKGYKADMLHGDMGQPQRDSAMARFKKKRTSLLVCTDVAARGIDVNDLTHVFNFGMPQDPESYVHRIGRTGRAGKTGKAITLIEGKSFGKLRWLEKIVKSRIELKTLPSSDGYKKSVINRNIEQLQTLMNVVQEKGEDFKVDSSFSEFEKAFADFSKEEIMKIFFSKSFNSEFKRVDELGNIEEDLSQKGKRNKSSSRPNRREQDRRRESNGESRNSRNSRNGDNIRVFMNMGKNDGLGLNLLLGKLAQQVGVKRNYINNVQLKDRFSFFDIPPQYGQRLIESKGVKINDSNVRFEIASGR